MVIACVSVLTVLSLWFRQSVALRVVVVSLLMIALTGQAWMLSQTGRTLFPPDRPTLSKMGESIEEGVKPDALVADTFHEGAFVALKAADAFIRPRVDEIWGFALCLCLLAMRPVARRAVPESSEQVA